MTLAACSNSDELTGNAGNGTDASSVPTAVQFSTYLAGGQTRAGSGGTVGAQTTSTLQTQGFGVFAYNTGTNNWSDDNTTYTPNFMYNQKVHVETGTAGWKYEPIKYWPNDFSDGNVDDKQGTNGEENNATGSEKGSKLSFFAYAPYVDAMSYDALSKDNGLTHGDGTDLNAVKTKATDGTTADAGIIGMTFNTTKGAPYVRYHLASTDIEKAVDLLWGKKLKDTYALADGTTQDMSKKEYNTDLTKQAANEKIGFSFKHALARIGGNTDLQENTTKKDNDNGHVKVILDIDNGKWDASTAITGGSKDGTTLVTVKEIKIRDYDTYAKESGAKTDTYTSTTTGGLRQEGWFNLATGTWDKYNATNDANSTDANTKVSYNVTIKDGKDGTLTLNPVIAEPSTAPTYSTSWTATGVEGFTGVVDGKAISVYKTPASDGDNKDNGILMIPTTTEDNLSQTLVVTVDYLVRTYDDHLATNKTEIEQVITNAVNIPAGALAPNKVYTLLIHLGLTSVKFEAEVASWDAADGTSTSGKNTDEGNKSDGNKKDIYLPSNTLATSLTVSANATTSITVPADTKSFTINLTGLTKDNTLTVTEPTTGVTLDNTTVPEGGTAKATVTLNENTNETVKANKVVITETDSESKTVSTTTVTINQAAKKSE